MTPSHQPPKKVGTQSSAERRPGPVLNPVGHSGLALLASSAGLAQLFTACRCRSVTACLTARLPASFLSLPDLPFLASSCAALYCPVLQLHEKVGYYSVQGLRKLFDTATG